MQGASLLSHAIKAFFAGSCALGLAACTMSSGASLDSGEGNSAEIALEQGQRDAVQSAEVRQADLLASDSFASPQLAPQIQVSTRILRAPARNALGVELMDGEGFNKIIIRRAEASATPFEFEVSRLDNPPRLVVDVLTAANQTPQSFVTADSELVERVRIGAHPEKSRFVLDLVEGELIEHRVEGVQPTMETGMGGDALVVTVARPERLEVALVAGLGNSVTTESGIRKPSTIASRDFHGTARAELDSTARAELDNAARAELDEEAFADLNEPNANEQIAAQEPSMKPNLDTPVLGEVRPRVVALALEPVAPGENMVVAELSGNPTFELKKTAPSEYVLALEGAEVDASAMNTLVATPGAGQIRTVRPVVSGNDVLLRIFADPSTSLSARAAQNKIVVISRDQDSFRAQMDPEQAEAQGDDAGVKVRAENPNGGELDAGVAALLGEQPMYTGRLISLDLQDTDIDNALRIIAEVSNLNIIASDDVTGKVTLRLIDVPWDQALDVILKTNGLDKVQEGNVVRIAPVEKLRLEREALKQAQQAEEELEPLQVRYIRVSYAKASDLRPLVESVVSERGSVAYDERTNQLIVKDIRKGIRNVVELVSKLDLRTPQILLETQIVEANRNLLRALGTNLGFKTVQSPATGNATGSNFPNSIGLGGSSNFPAGAVDPSLGGSSITLLLDSADATKSLSLQINALEQEGRVRIVSRPAVATTNNTPATIKSVERIRVKTPSGGTVVGVGQGATPSSGGSTATESIEIGIVLEVTPQASPDYFVLLDLSAKSSAFGSERVDNIPSEIERSATSSVLVSSGQTFAMGGIYRITDSDNVTGVPFLKDIPVLGHLFRTIESKNRDEELIFFVTPRIIEGSFDDAAMKISL
jgi:type IV pilus secretin PilQ/predicted competence protein